MRGLFREKFNRNSKESLINTQDIAQRFFRGNFDVDANNQTTNNNSGLSEEQTKAISKFIKVITEKAMSRVLAILDEAKKTPREEVGENLVENIARIVKENVLKEIDGSLSPKNLFNNTLQ